MNGKLGWQPANEKWFEGVGAGTRFVPFRNRCNVRRGDLDDSQWYNIGPRELVPLGPEIPE